MSRLTQFARPLAMTTLLLSCGVMGAMASDQPLNPKDALAPIYRENPKLPDATADRARLRNEGIAHYEGGLTLDRAVASFQAAYDIGQQPVDAFDLALVYMKQHKVAEARLWAEKALASNPDFAAAQYLMGVIEKLDGNLDAARARWSRANELHPTDANLHYELAMLASAAKDEHVYLQELVRALELDPDHKSSLYQMYRYYQVSGNKEMAGATLKRFNKIKATERFSRKERPFDDSELITPLRDDPQHGGAGFPFIDSKISFETVQSKQSCVLAHLMRIAVIAGPAHEDLLAVCDDGGLLRIAGDKAEMLGKLDGQADDIDVAWLDAQGPRIVAAGSSGVRLSSPLNKTPLSFDPIDDKPAKRLLLADFEHDGSLDILTDAAAAPLAKIDGIYKRQQATYSGSSLADALQTEIKPRVADLRRRGMADLVISRGSDVQFVMDGPAGYQQGPGLHISDTATVSQIDLADLDNTGVLDLVAATSDGLTVVWDVGKQDIAATPDRVTRLPSNPAAPLYFAIADINNDGRRDIVTIDTTGTISVYLNNGPRSFEKRQLSPVPAPNSNLIAYDENRDGLIDIAYIDTTGSLVTLRNASKDVGNSIDVLLNGRRSPPTGQLTQVELRKGDLYSYAQSDGGLVHLGLGTEHYAEVVRLEWPNGFIENKIKVDATQEPYSYQESERIAGSCPTIFIRTPEGFRYLTDAMITTAIGILESRGQYFDFGDEEHVVISPGLLTELDGRLDLRVTEELRETTYIDRAALLAVDHPARVRLGTTERLAPPSAEQAPWYAARRLVPAVHAAFEGHDVTQQLAYLDHDYADTVHRTRNPGFAQLSTLELQLGDDVDPSKVDAVFATGWFQAFDSTAVIGAFKGGSPDFQFPELQENFGGEWRSAGYIGIPAGQNRTAVLTLKAPLKSRQLRILSNFSVYWDEIAFSVAGEARTSVADLPLQQATLRFRGFSRPIAKDPETLDYDTVDYGMIWNPMPGRFTDYGPVKSLVADNDGQYTVMGGGDELALSFRAPTTPPPPGFERSFVLVLDGHVKDADRYTAGSSAVEPMPFLSMSKYPGKPSAASPPETLASARMRQRPGLDFTLTPVSSVKKRGHE